MLVVVELAGCLVAAAEGVVSVAAPPLVVVEAVALPCFGRHR